MPRCPQCDTHLEPVHHQGVGLSACDRCGGLWIPAAALTELAKHHVATLAPLDDAWPDRGSRPPDRDGLIDPSTGQTLVSRTFPFAPGLALLVAPGSQAIFFRDGQLRALHQILSPGTLPQPKPVAAPTPPPAPAAGSRREQPHRAADGSVLESIGWPERAPGQPWISWFFCGTPLPLAVFMLAPAVLLFGLFFVIATDETTSFLAGLLVILAWPIGALITTVALSVIWVFGGGPQLSFFQAYLLMLRVQPLLLACEGVAWIVGALLPVWLVATAVRVMLQAPVYRYVIELDADDAIRLAIAVPIINTVLTLVVLSGLAATAKAAGG